MREPDSEQNKGPRLAASDRIRPSRRRWLIAGGLIAVGFLGFLLFLLRNAILGGTVVFVVATSTLLPGVTVTASIPPSSLDERIAAYIDHLTVQQQIGQLLMLSVYTDAYSSALDEPLQHTQVGSVIFFPQHNGGPLMPTTLPGLQQLIHDLQGHATNPLLIATDEEGGSVDRLAPYYGPTLSPAALAATGDPQQAYAQATVDAGRLRDVGINVDFAPLADVYQGGAIDSSRMFGTTPEQVTNFAGAFLDGLQQHGVAGTLKHWPGIGAVPANPDFALPTLSHTQAQLNALDFASFRALLPHQPDLIMVTHVLVPAYDPSLPASLSPILIDGVLRGQLGYQGVVVSDAMEADSIQQFMRQQGYTDPAKAVGEASVLAILAGEDIIECPLDPTLEQGVVDAVSQAVFSGRISEARLQVSLQRIVRLKVKLGILTLP